MTRPRAPLLVERQLLLTSSGQPDTHIIEQLVAFQRSGRRLLLVAPQPTSWRPTRRGVDKNLVLQQQLHQLIRRAGAELDGITYLSTGFFARRKSRINDLDQLAKRYDVSAGDLVLIGTDPTLLESIVQSGGRAFCIGQPATTGSTGFGSLKSALADLD